MPQSNNATMAGTSNYRQRLMGVVAEEHFRHRLGVWISSIGLGSYLGNTDDRTDDAYRHAVKRAVELGCNVFDTAANYRCQRSERSIGEALEEIFAQGKAVRDEIV